MYRDCYRDCGSDFHLMPTGSFPDCSNVHGVYDLGGNVWEAVQTGDHNSHFRGGAYNCGDPALAHTCSYDGWAAGTFPNRRGFRCCADGDHPQ